MKVSQSQTPRKTETNNKTDILPWAVNRSPRAGTPASSSPQESPLSQPPSPEGSPHRREGLRCTHTGCVPESQPHFRTVLSGKTLLLPPTGKGEMRWPLKYCALTALTRSRLHPGQPRHDQARNGQAPPSPSPLPSGRSPVGLGLLFLRAAVVILGNPGEREKYV